MSENRNNKRYYWLKLNENFFDREEMKIIEDMKNGKDYIIFYMKLLLRSVGTEGKLMFRDVIPYTPEMLSSITNTDVDTVRVATDMFVKLGLMEKWDDGTLFMAETQNMIGSETGWAKKKRLQRESEDNVLPNRDNVPQLSKQCPTETETETDIETELDIEQQQDENKEAKKIENVVCMLDKKVTFEEGKKILRAANENIDLVKEKYEIAKVSDYKNLIGFMLKAIKENWQMPKDQTDKPKSKVDTKFHNFEQRTSQYTPDELEKMVLDKGKGRSNY